MDTLRKVLDAGFDEVLVRLPGALKAEGFGVLTEIDVQDTLKKKIGVDLRRYKILGACNPLFAKRALDVDLEVGRFLPCNVVVYEDDQKRAVVSAIDPVVSMQGAGDTPALHQLAVEVRAKLARAVGSLQ